MYPEYFVSVQRKDIADSHTEREDYIYMYFKITVFWDVRKFRLVYTDSRMLRRNYWLQLQGSFMAPHSRK
jgi:hypothetical protein